MGYISWNGGKGFEPVGTSSSQFTGTLDGNNYTVSNLTILRADDTYGQGSDDEEYVGIIGYASTSTISNLNVTNSKIKGWQYVGGIAGYVNNTTISNVSFNQGLESDDCDPGYCVWARYGTYGGGIVGYSASSTITHAVVGASVKGSGNIIGGIVGIMFASNISYATSTARIDGGTSIGGIAGSSNNSTISHVLATGLVDVRYDDGKIGDNGGGIVGYSSYSTTTHAVATGDVQGHSNLGGVVGLSEYSSFSFATSSGSVTSTGGQYTGGFVGTASLSTFSTSSASGMVIGLDRVGGFVGSSQCQSVYMNDSAHGLIQVTGQYGGGFVGIDSCEGTGSTFTRSSATGNIQGAGSTTYLGGFIGSGFYSTISESFATGNITGADDYAGGFAGQVEGVSSPGTYGLVIEKSYALGSVTSIGNYVGGYIGGLSGGVKVSNSYSRGDVEAYGDVGGFVGSMSAIAKIEKSYSSGHTTMTGTGVVAGFVAMYAAGDDMFTNSYWDGETSGFSDDSSYIGYPIYATSTSAMKNQYTFINSGWDFASIWGQSNAVNDGYPYLYHQTTSSVAPVLTTVQAIPSRVHMANARYDFTVSDACNIQATFLNVSPASEAEVLITDATNPSGIKSAAVTGMRVGSTYSFSFTCVDRFGNVSNSLSVGPFTVVADSEPLTPPPVTSRSSPTFGGSTSERFSPMTKRIVPVAPLATSTVATTTPRIFTRNLYVGSVGADVKALQQYLNAKGFVIAKTGPGSVGKETMRFGLATKAALIKFQKANGILPATGTFGPRTRGVVGR